MSESNTVERLSTAVANATKSAKFCVSGSLPVADPGIEVEGLGRVKVPLKQSMPKELIARCSVAPYGKGTQTLVDTNVRNTYELDPKKFRLSDEWNAAIADVTRHVAQQLALPAEQLEAKLYKLLVYQRGGFFLPHRDSEKHDRMLASMIVVLPNRFDGGRLVVRHGAVEQTLSFDEAAKGQAACYAAFFADCEHEVKHVYSGVRLCLAYNLVLKPKRTKAHAGTKPSVPAAVLAQSIETWVGRQPAMPLVFALEHHYTQHGLSLDLLKGGDRQLAEVVVAAAEKAGCLVHLAQVTRHLCQFADDGSFESGYSRRWTRRQQIEIGETYDDDLTGTEWTDLQGKKQSWGEIPLDLASIVSSMPIDQWKPTSEEFEGYTGNAGNTLDRWYHRSAIVVWRRDHHFDVVASSGAADSIPLFCSMAKKLANTPKKRLEEARADCICFARAIIAKWPRRWVGHYEHTGGDKVPYDDFPDGLLALHDQDTVAMFLSKVREQDQSLRLDSFVVAACREFGWNAFADQLQQLFASRPSQHGREEIPLRDVQWLCAFCCEKPTDIRTSGLAGELCALAVKRFCEPYPPRPKYYSPHYRQPPSVSETSLPLLLKALLACGRDDDAARVIHFVRKLPNEFRMDECLVPTLKNLVPWSQKQFGAVHPQLASWLTAVRQQLESAIAIPPAPPTDCSRPADVDCNCQHCAQLKTFLADPAAEVDRISASEDKRGHLVSTIERHQCDVKHTLERKGRPFSLVLTKTAGSFERAVKRFEANRQLLNSLPPVS